MTKNCAAFHPSVPFILAPSVEPYPPFLCATLWITMFIKRKGHVSAGLTDDALKLTKKPCIAPVCIFFPLKNQDGTVLCAKPGMAFYFL
jgi:hypothetical protein